MLSKMDRIKNLQGIFRSAVNKLRPLAKPASKPATIAPVTMPKLGGFVAPSVPNYVGLAQTIASQVRVPTKQYTIDDVFGRQDQELARQNISSRVARLLDPELRRGNETINTDFAQRGLFRSGLRNQGLTEFGDDIADRRKTQEEELYNIRLAEAMEQLKQRQLEAEREAALVSQNVNFRNYI